MRRRRWKSSRAGERALRYVPLEACWGRLSASRKRGEGLGVGRVIFPAANVPDHFAHHIGLAGVIQFVEEVIVDFVVVDPSLLYTVGIERSGQMSTLGSLAGKAEREQRLLSRLNEAVIDLEVAALGKNQEFSLSEDQLQESRRSLSEFVSKLQSELLDEKATADIQSLGFRIRTGMKPLEDWQEDLVRLSQQLAQPEPIRLEDLPILEDILSLLDNEFADDLRRLYAH